MDDGEVRVVADAFDLFEGVFKFREIGIAIDRSLHQRKIKIGSKRQGLSVNLCPAADKYFPWHAVNLQFIEGSDRFHTGECKTCPADNDGCAIRQGPPNGFEGFAAHNDRVARGELFEPLEILGQMPRDAIALADDAIQGHRCDRFELFHSRDGKI